MNGTMFLNRSSGARLAGDDLAAMREAAAASGIELIELAPGIDVSRLIRKRLEVGVRLFLAAGGDGTVNHVLQPLVRTDAVLAVIPVGTRNHFARDLGIPLDWREAIAVALSGGTRQVDVARVNDRFFVNNLSIGLYPELVARREERGRDYPRWKALLYAMWVTLRRYPHVSLVIDDEHHQEVVRTHVFMASNNSYDLSRIGIESPRPNLTEGRLSVYWLPHVRRIALIRFAAHYLAGRARTAPGFRSFRTLRMKVHTPRPRLKVGIDGELFDLTTPLSITAVPQALNVRVP